MTALADDDTDESVFLSLYGELETLAPASSFSFEEPSELKAIQALRPDGPRRMDLDLSDDELRDHILGHFAWRDASISHVKYPQTPAHVIRVIWETTRYPPYPQR